MSEHAPFSPALQSALSHPPLERKGWQTTSAPSYIAFFLWAVFFDQLGRRTLAIGGIGWSVLGAAVASLLCYFLLYRVPALWGQKTGWPFTVIGSSTFGTTGTVGLTFIVFGLAQILIMAVATLYAVDWAFQGLSLCGLVSLKWLEPMTLTLGAGAGTVLELRSPLILITSLVWIYAASLTGHFLVRIIAALMKIYPIFPALMLALAMILTLTGLPSFRPLEIDPATSAPVVDGGPRAFLMMVQMIFGFFAIAGTVAADFGAVNRTERDVRLGGWIGVALAAWTVATLSLLTVAGAVGRYSAPLHLKNTPGVGNFSFRTALVLGLPEKLAGAIFLFFALSSLAQTCFSADIIGHRFAAVWPRISRLGWNLIGTTAAWPLVATGLAIRLEEIFTLLGAIFAPMVGAMTADYVRNRGVWPGPRRGLNPAGLVAWLCGVAVGLVPLIAVAGGWSDGSRLQPSSVFAFAAAFLIYTLLAAIGAESQALPIPKPLPACELPDAADVPLSSEPAPTA
ncbi:cytosine permease [Singulisphaera sp. GP187]|uniref:purine-cytosine permease-like transporter n=1 Tax=Singulisphaera sp. GP187 TaxID=1882752 RepID=UPI000926F901|nr:purine-cytosine permease-like transporter [Singulisphaera sp. GP187]SIO63025.1 cytosine permease [Singulisphaera sp. GP187]